MRTWARTAAAWTRTPGEIRRLVEALTVNVSEFFRNPKTIRALTREVLPVLVAQRRAQGAAPIRVWSAGCATGEEPYSLAMALSESLGDALQDFPVVIYATDVDRPSLAAARARPTNPSTLPRTRNPPGLSTS